MPFARRAFSILFGSCDEWNTSEHKEVWKLTLYSQSRLCLERGQCQCPVVLPMQCYSGLYDDLATTLQQAGWFIRKESEKLGFLRQCLDSRVS